MATAKLALLVSWAVAVAAEAELHDQEAVATLVASLAEAAKSESAAAALRRTQEVPLSKSLMLVPSQRLMLVPLAA